MVDLFDKFTMCFWIYDNRKLTELVFYCSKEDDNKRTEAYNKIKN